MKKKGFTLVELLVVIAIIAMLLAILMPALSRVRALAMRLMCGTNLNGLGKACLVYANENQDSYPIIGSSTCFWPAAATTQLEGGGFSGDTGWYLSASTFTGAQGPQYITQATLTSSLYLLIKYADVSTASFVCRSSSQKKFDLQSVVGQTVPTTVTDLLQCWDFGPIKGNSGSNPWQFCSYSYQQGYRATQSDTTSYPVNVTSQAGLAVMADRSPWFIDDQGTLATASDSTNGPYQLVSGDFDGTTGVITSKDKQKLANSKAHNQEGQNVLFADAHVSFETGPNVGIEQDNIYTPWKQNGTGITDWKQGGEIPVRGSIQKSRPQSDTDSLLIN